MLFSHIGGTRRRAARDRDRQLRDLGKFRRFRDFDFKQENTRLSYPLACGTAHNRRPDRPSKSDLGPCSMDFTFPWAHSRYPQATTTQNTSRPRLHLGTSIIYNPRSYFCEI